MDETYLNIRNSLTISKDLVAALYLYRANVNHKRENIIKYNDSYEYILEFMNDFSKINLYLFRDSKKLATYRIRLKNKDIYKSIKDNLYQNTPLIVNREKLDDVPTKESTESCITEFIEKGLKEINIESVEKLLEKFAKIKNAKEIKELKTGIGFLVTALTYREYINKKPMNLYKNGFMVNVEERPITIERRTDDPKELLKIKIFPIDTTGIVRIETLNLRENDDLDIIRKILSDVNTLLYGVNRISKKKMYTQQLEIINALEKTFKEKNIEKVTYKEKTISKTNIYGEVKINLSNNVLENEKILCSLAKTFTPGLKISSFYNII